MGISFRQADPVLQHTKDRSRLASIGACSDLTISKYAWIACAINLQKVYELIEEAWKFLVALDMSTHMSTSYLDIRVFINLNMHGIVNVHLLAVPVYERHTDAMIWTLQQRLLMLYVHRGRTASSEF